jgi:hypothetical protein
LTLPELTGKEYKAGNIEGAYQNVYEIVTELLCYLEGRELPNEEAEPVEEEAVVHE